MPFSAYALLARHTENLTNDPPLTDELSQTLDRIANLAHTAARSKHSRTRANAVVKIRKLIEGV